MKFLLKILTIFIFVILLWQFAEVELYSNGPATWFRHFGGTSNDFGIGVDPTSDGGFIVSGETYSFSNGGKDIAIYKLDSSGNKIWFKNYGGSSNETGYSIQQTSEGGYIVAGYTYSYTNGLNDFAIYKLNSSGNKVWFKHYGGTQNDYAYSIQQTSEGGYIVAGRTESYTYGDCDFAIYKLDSSGNKIWFKHYGGTDTDRGYSIQQTSDGGYIVAGDTKSYSYGGYDFAIYKLDSSGNKVWFKHYGGTNHDYGQSVQQVSDGGYILAGYTYSYTYGGTDFAIYKLDSNGNKVWFKHYGGTAGDFCQSIQQTSDGGYITAGYTSSYTYGGDDLAIYKLDSSGNKVWFKHYGGSYPDVGYSTRQALDGGYILVGSTQSYTFGENDIAVYKLDSNGNK